MTLDELKQKSKEHLKLTDELDQNAQELSKKKAQWSEWLSLFSVEYKKALWKLNQVKKDRFEYYYANYNVTLDKREIREIYLPGDEKIIEAEKLVETHKEKIDLCERTMRSLTAMGFDIKNIIEYRKLMSGII